MKVNKMQTIFGELDANQMKTVKDGVKEMSVHFTRIDDEKLALKDIVNSIHDDTKLNKKLINRIAKSYYKNSFNDEVTLDTEFESLYTNIIGTN